MTIDNKLSSLGGLKRTAQPQPDQAAATAVSEPVPARFLEEPSAYQHEAQTASIPGSGGSSTPPVKQEESSGGVAGENLTIRASKELIKAFEAHKTKTKLSFPNVLFNAIDSTYAKLPVLLNNNEVKVPGPNLFGRGDAVVMISVDHSEKDSKSMRINSKHMAVLDNLAAELAGGNRNRLIVTALTEYLKDEI